MTSLSLRKQLYVLIFLSETMPTMEVYCPASEPTMREVQTCPTTLEALKTAMRIKNCESMSTMQNCTSAENFRYHCVLQMNLNKLVDVCAPSIYSQGKCVKYDTVGKGIQQIEEKSCQHYKNPCPIGFSSWNSTAYADCYMLLEDLKENDDSTTENILPIIAIVVFVVLFLVLLVIGLVIKRRKGHKEAENNDEGRKKQRVAFNCEEGKCHFYNDNEEGLSNTEEGKETQKIRADTGLEENQVQNDAGPDVSDTEVNTLDNEDEVFLLSDSEKTEGFDQSSFESVIRKYKLQSVEKIFKENEIDCIRSFVDLSANDLENLGLKIGQIKKCLSVIKILNNRNRKTVSANNITGRKLDYSLAENLQSLPNVF